MADIEEKHRISVAGTAVQAAKHEMPLELIVHSKYTLQLPCSRLIYPESPFCPTPGNCLKRLEKANHISH
jgi:hypothetical protein